ncbi:5'/3'-nucleotidase SurE [Paracoccus aerodenitrificans]|uniref:5'/3'-nucleotidase SurE n=1 Tax=Paracoccus aerodenitrificans TaxID=3017781 RepID=UPI0022F10228|nr:5'/3'-nucleotidase SurE [Paracoccus aerodenitrificans]WBU65090.1 5'/3'-nucleotidase SurE [Paracoccus aerodenitrificans]
MRILITNDDGINAPGLKVAEEIAAEIAGPEGEVWVVAPAFEQSGVAHCISFSHPTMIAQLAERRYAAEGSPADCVLAAIHDIMADAPPDLVISGVNRGNNSGENAAYSGTVGGAMEAALQGLPAIALSQYFGPAMLALDDPFECARKHGGDIVRQLLDHADWNADQDFRLFYNVNFPPTSADGMKGLRVAPQGRRRGAGFSVEPFVAPNGRRFLWVRGAPQDAEGTKDSDLMFNLEGYTTVTPMRADLTCHSSLADLRRALEA